ncbi:uncharacterized protein [Osmerus mordax]|uniref:uncharacterized protein isoform X2 n=1 Tax=Osmerus mordax TaxID=8014 RepID=UPI0035100B24
MTIMENCVRFLLNLQFLFLLSGLHFNCPAFAYPARHETRHRYFTERVQTRVSPSLAQHFEQMQQEQQSLSNVKQKRAKPVNVQCYPDHIEIVVNSNLFENGFLIEGNELHLGVEEEEQGCRAVQSSANEFTLVAGLQDCGAKRSLNENFLVYTNVLIYSPRRAADGVVRMEQATIPVECHFGRKFSVSTDALQPTWIPYSSSVFAEEILVFDLKIMTSDWLHKRGTRVYFLGGMINIEASVLVAHHTRMRVFINSCVATLGPDPSSLPRYEFIQNGCLVDSQLTGSRSQFMPRTSDDKLQFSIDAFRFHKQEGGEIFISCLLAAVPVSDSADTQLKACSFINERWRSSDGPDLLCSRCQRYNGADSPNPGALKTQVSKPYNTGFHKSLKLHKGWEEETALAPLLVFPGNPKSLPLTSRVSGHSEPRRRLLSSSKWKSRVDNGNSQRGNMHEDSPLSFTPEEEDPMKATPESISTEQHMRDEKRQKASEQGYGKFLDKTDTGGFLAFPTPEPRRFKDFSSEGSEQEPRSMDDLNEGPRQGLLEIPTPEPRSMEDFSPEENEGSRQGILDSLEDFSTEENEGSGQESSPEVEETEVLGQGSGADDLTKETVSPGIPLLLGDLDEATPVNSSHEDGNPAVANGDDVPAPIQGFETPAAIPGDQGRLHGDETPSDLSLFTSKEEGNHTETATVRRTEGTDADITIEENTINML